MAKRFSFYDDEDDFFDDDTNQEEVYSRTQSNKEKEKKKVVKNKKKIKLKGLKLKPWQIAIGVILVIFIVFFVYIFSVSNNNGPVYGNRCDGITAIDSDAKNATVNTIKEKYSSIKDMSIEITCKEVKIDIEFEDGMDTEEAQAIGEETAKTLDETVGLEKEDGKTYSNLYGYINNEAQYDVLLYLTSTDSEDFPIYATKHHAVDEFSYTLASVKDQESTDKAKSTVK